MADIAPTIGAGASAPGNFDKVSTRPSRRAVFGSVAALTAGAVAVSAAVAAEPADQAADRQFDRMIAEIARYDRALYATTKGTSYDEYHRLALAYGAAHDRALFTPAVNWRHLVWKLEEVWQGEDAPSQRLKAVILRDARLLAGRRS